ncbi:MAG: hypothetical protein V2A66_04695 [Pseudomonadota bacterium]
MQKIEDFDEAFDDGKVSIDFKGGTLTEGISALVKLPPLAVPAWLALEIEAISKIQANSKSSVIRQLLVEAIEGKRRMAS